MDGGEEQNPLSIILANGRTWEMAFEGEKSLAEEGVGGEDEVLLQDLERKGFRWDDSLFGEVQQVSTIFNKRL